MSYVDGFVAAVPSANRENFKKHVEDAAAIFKEYGALKVVECWGDDVPEGEVTSFPMAVKRKEDETVVFSPGSSGHRGRCVTKGTKNSWPIRACSPKRTRCPSTGNA
jgi:uncharacterized protein YbaA (DUF1428 family)